MSAFGAAINAIFADPNMSVSAEYRSGGADPAVSVRVIRVAPDALTDWSGGQFVRASAVFDVRMSDVAVLEAGDTFTIGGDLFTVDGDPLRDSERLCWKAAVRDGA